jgi:hypothetical protein
VFDNTDNREQIRKELMVINADVFADNVDLLTIAAAQRLVDALTTRFKNRTPALAGV